MKLGGESFIYILPKIGHAAPPATCPDSCRTHRRHVSRAMAWRQVATGVTPPPHQLRLQDSADFGSKVGDLGRKAPRCMDEASRRRTHDETMLLIRNYLEGHAMVNTVQALDFERNLADLATFTSLITRGDFEGVVTYFGQCQKESYVASFRILYYIWRQMCWELLSVKDFSVSSPCSVLCVL
ncbi:hypothetical protein ISN45_At03g031930 [Arabidopsis thaliana x Arabidopsis arenosa]|uniref:Uncharacterized protein n=1 Tax=Arabidopsis thaliana x Arabidopsis arenosa TaxID=1240361 RepID=A0A8T2EXJ2_9BRAS|nr:hypothetical protein ISN45_At03g031930 [Arabidopsis thaliana x Arabidopsis arenosa]